MFNGRNKILKKDNQEPTNIEEEVARALYDLEINNADIKSDLQFVFITQVREFEIETKGKASKPAIVVQIPYRSLPYARRVHSTIVSELEKKFKKHFLIMGQRTILPIKGNRQRRPRNRTLTSVHESVLNDLIFPSSIVAKRTRVRLDGSKLIKVSLDGNDKNAFEDKTEALSRVYRALTTKDVVFDFKATEKANRA